jgi:hypothetical protein
VPYDKILDLEVGDFQKIAAFKRDSPAATQLPMCSAVTGLLSDMCAGYTVDIATGEETGVPERFFRAYHFYGLYGIPNSKSELPDPHNVGSGISDYHLAGGEKQIRIEIWRWGPVATGIKVYPDFYMFDAKNDIYKWNSIGPQVGGHAIVLIGWGEKKGHKYWLVQNSWGAEWGDHGYFKMDRGTNDCGIESNVSCVVPDYFYPTGVVLDDERRDAEVSGRGRQDIFHHLHHTLESRSAEISDLSKTIDRSDINRANRNKISNDVLQQSGGIDPTTGYTRRIMVSMPWINFQRPVSLGDLPLWSTFVAGLDSTPSKVRQIRSRLRSPKTQGRADVHKFSAAGEKKVEDQVVEDQVVEDQVVEDQVGQIYIGFVIILGVTILIVLGIILYRRIKR